MSRVKLSLMFSSKTLVIVIGAKKIECCVTESQGATTKLIDESLLQMMICEENSADLPINQLNAMLEKLFLQTTTTVVDQVRVVVADCWLAVAGVPWNSAIKHTTSASIYGRKQIAGMGFSLSSFDTLRLDDAAFGEPRLAVVYPMVLVNLLQKLTLQLNARLASVLPLSVIAWDLSQRKRNTQSPVLALFDAGMMLFARSTGGNHSRISGVTMRIESDINASNKNLHQMWNRLCLREPQLLEVEQIDFFDLNPTSDAIDHVDMPFIAVDFSFSEKIKNISPSLRLAVQFGKRSHALNAISTTPKAVLWQWLVLGLGIALVSGLSVQAFKTNTYIRSLIAIDATSNIAPVLPKAKSWSKDELVRVRAVNSAIRELNLPITAILRALEPPKDIRVSLLNMETLANAPGSQTSVVKLIAEARTGAEMARYIAYLSDKKPFTGAYLTKHDVDENSAERPYRFTVEVQWKE